MSEWIATMAGMRLCANVRRAAEHLKGIHTELRLLREQPFDEFARRVADKLEATEAKLSRANGDRRKYLEGVRATLIELGREAEAVRDERPQRLTTARVP